MEGIGSGLLIVGFFVPVFYILLILSLPALLIIFFGQPGKQVSLFEVLGTSMALVWLGACFILCFWNYLCSHYWSCLLEN